MIIMKYSPSMSFTPIKMSNIIDQMYNCDIDHHALWASMNISRLYDRGDDIMTITLRWGNL